MTHTSATAPWPPAPATASRSTTRFSVRLPGAPDRVTGLASELLNADGSGSLWLELPSGVVTVEFAADEPYASVVQRARAAMAEVTYPSSSATSDSTVVAVPNGMGGL